jgi:hypothetical protein
MSDHALSALHALATPAEQVAETTPVTAASPSVTPLPAEGRFSPGAMGNAGLAVGAPRECSPSQGIEIDCTYN